MANIFHHRLSETIKIPVMMIDILKNLNQAPQEYMFILLLEPAFGASVVVSLPHQNFLQ
jgi:hypothetical protein